MNDETVHQLCRQAVSQVTLNYLSAPFPFLFLLSFEVFRCFLCFPLTMKFYIRGKRMEALDLVIDFLKIG